MTLLRAALLALAAAAACAGAAPSTGILAARWHPSGFPEADDNYNAVTAASDGRIYYVLCAHGIDQGARLFSYDPASGVTTPLADLTEAAGEKGLRAVPQGKVHVALTEHQGKLYFATHLGYYRHVDGKELVGVPPAGYRPYPGGHFLSYDLATRRIEKLGTAPGGEGIITMAMDTHNGRLFGLTWPSGRFLSLDIKTRRLQDHGPTARQGEKGLGPDFRVVCRTIAVEPRAGFAFLTTSDGAVLRFDPAAGRLETLGIGLRRPVFGSWDPQKPGHMGYHWRQAVWYAPERSFYATHGNSSYLFRFHSGSHQIDILDRLAPEKARASGEFEAFPYGSLALTLGPDGRTLYFLSGTPAGEEIRLVTYDIPERRYSDHGALVLDDGRRPTWAQAIAVGRDGRVYTVSKLREGARQRVDLLSFPDPLRAPATPEPRYRLTHSWLNPAGPVHPLREAHSLCFDRDGNVLVIDSVGSRIQRFTREGKWLGEVGNGPGRDAGQFKDVRDARTAPWGEIYALDTGNFRIQVFSPEGRFLRMFGSQGSGPGQMLRAHGLEFSPDGRRLYVVDVDNNRVSVFDPRSGQFLFAFGKKGSGTGEFRDAHGIGVAPDGDVIVSNYYGPVQRFTADGKFRFEFAPSGFRGWTHFHSMAADHQGNTYLAARHRDGRNAIAVYDARGGFVTAWAAATAEGEQGVKTALIDRDGTVFVAVESRTSHGVRVYRREP